MKFYSNLPDAKHVPYPIISKDPSIGLVLSSFTAKDYFRASLFQLFPLSLYVWERVSPAIHPTKRRALFMIQIPFFAVAGVAFSYNQVLKRFWGWEKNDDLLGLEIEEKKKKWSESDF